MRHSSDAAIAELDGSFDPEAVAGAVRCDVRPGAGPITVEPVPGV